MKRLILIPAWGFLLLSGCVLHYRDESFHPPGSGYVMAGDRRVWLVILSTTKMTQRETTFPERLGAFGFTEHVARGPYSLGIGVRTAGVENGIPVEVTSAKLLLASGQVTEVLSRNEPALKGFTAHKMPSSALTPRDPFSSCEFKIPLGDRLAFAPHSSVRAIVTVKIGGEEEVTITVDFKATEGTNYWGPLIG